jgi:hypothetical protein
MPSEHDDPTLPVFDISDSDTAIYYYCRFPLGDARRTGLFKSNEQKQNNFRHARLGITTRNTIISLHLNAFIFYEQVLDPHAMSHRYLDEWNVLLANENVYFHRYYDCIRETSSWRSPTDQREMNFIFVCYGACSTNVNRRFFATLCECRPSLDKDLE